MLFIQLFTWWYTQGWTQVFRSLPDQLIRIAHVFSVPILIRTLWAPWRRIITYPGAGLDAKLRAFGDNMVSRAIGFTVRMLVLVAAGLILLLALVGGLVLLLLWPAVPLAIVYFLYRGITG